MTTGHGPAFFASPRARLILATRDAARPSFTRADALPAVGARDAMADAKTMARAASDRVNAAADQRLAFKLFWENPTKAAAAHAVSHDLPVSGLAERIKAFWRGPGRG